MLSTTIEFSSAAAQAQADLQDYPRMAGAVGAVGGEPAEAAAFLATMFAGMGDSCAIKASTDESMTLHHTGLRVVRDASKEEREVLLDCWAELWRGAVHSHRQFVNVNVRRRGDELVWTIRPAR